MSGECQVDCHFERYHERLLIRSELFGILEIFNLFFEKKEISFVLLKKLHIVCAVSIKSSR